MTLTHPYTDSVENGAPVRSWDCGCRSDNETLARCPAHEGPVGTASPLRADDPRLNVVFAASPVTLHFTTAQGGPGRLSGLLSRASLLKVMNLIGELDDTHDPDEEGAGTRD